MMDLSERVAHEVIALAIRDSQIDVNLVKSEAAKIAKQRLIDEARAFLSGCEDLTFWCNIADMDAQFVIERFGVTA